MGTLCHVGDVASFALALRRLEEGLESLRANRRSLRERALQNYSFDQCGPKYIEAIREVAAAKPVTRKPDSHRRSAGQWIDRAHRLVRYRRHFKT